MVPHMIEDAFLPGDVPTGRPGGERPTLPPSERGLSLDEDKLKPIAIVGFCFRFPEDAVSPRGFWDMMMEKRCAMTESPKDRISVPGWHHPDSRRRGQVGDNNNNHHPLTFPRTSIPNPRLVPFTGRTLLERRRLIIRCPILLVVGRRSGGLRPTATAFAGGDLQSIGEWYGIR